jgi:hypothetical protein
MERHQLSGGTPADNQRLAGPGGKFPAFRQSRSCEASFWGDIMDPGTNAEADMNQRSRARSLMLMMLTFNQTPRNNQHFP